MSWFIAAVIIKIGSGIKTERSVEQNEEYGNPHIHKQLFFNKNAKAIQWRNIIHMQRKNEFWSVFHHILHKLIQNRSQT